MRKNKTRKITLTAKLFPEDRADELIKKLLGINVMDIAVYNKLHRKSPAKEGVVIVSLDRNSYLAAIGAQPGDIIRNINEYKIKDIKIFKNTIIKYRKKNSLIMLLQRQDQLYYITIKL